MDRCIYCGKKAGLLRTLNSYGFCKKCSESTRKEIEAKVSNVQEIIKYCQSLTDESDYPDAVLKISEATDIIFELEKIREKVPAFKSSTAQYSVALQLILKNINSAIENSTDSSTYVDSKYAESNYLWELAKNDTEYCENEENYNRMAEEIEHDYSVINNVGKFDSADGDIFISKCSKMISIVDELIPKWEKYHNYIPDSICAYKRLSMAFEKRGDYLSAAQACIMSLERGFESDETNTGMRGRLARMIKRGHLELTSEMKKYLTILPPEYNTNVRISENLTTERAIVNPTSSDTSNAESLLARAEECANHVNTTVKPDVFFRRLNFLLDTLLELQKYEECDFFTRTLPSMQYKKILENLGPIVDDFINRFYNSAIEKSEKLKSEKGRQNRLESDAISLISAFDVANTFWEGNNISPHYAGRLFTDANLEKVKSIVSSISEDISL